MPPTHVVRPQWRARHDEREAVIRLLWLQASCCGGETVSLLNAEQPDLLTTFDLLGVDLVWHPSFSRLQGRAARELLGLCETGGKKLDILVVEGAVPAAEDSSPHALAPGEPGIAEQVTRLARTARYVMAAGTCASLGCSSRGKRWAGCWGRSSARRPACPW